MKILSIFKSKEKKAECSDSTRISLNESPSINETHANESVSGTNESHTENHSLTILEIIKFSCCCLGKTTEELRQLSDKLADYEFDSYLTHVGLMDSSLLRINEIVFRNYLIRCSMKGKYELDVTMFETDNWEECEQVYLYYHPDVESEIRVCLTNEEYFRTHGDSYVEWGGSLARINFCMNNDYPVKLPMLSFHENKPNN